MKGLLIVAHGSRLASSNAEVMALVDKLAERLNNQGQNDWVAGSFLELTGPKVPEQMARAAESGVSHLVILPYFLAAGHHVENDLPALVKEAQQLYPAMKVELKTHIGLSDGMVDLMIGALD